VSVQRRVDKAIGRDEFQKSGDVKESLDFRILALCYDGFSRDRLVKVV
jgi:hypothetical protein